VVQPVHQPALFVPDIPAAEHYTVADFKRRDPRRDVDVVIGQQRSPGFEPNHESLVPVSFAIVRKHPDNRSGGHAPDIGAMLRDRSKDGGIGGELGKWGRPGKRGRLGNFRGMRAQRGVHDDPQADDEQGNSESPRAKRLPPLRSSPFAAPSFREPRRRQSLH